MLIETTVGDAQSTCSHLLYDLPETPMGLITFGRYSGVALKEPQHCLSRR